LILDELQKQHVKNELMIKHDIFGDLLIWIPERLLLEREFILIITNFLLLENIKFF
jgi:hypothetical protein